MITNQDAAETGITALSMLANISYAGMRAQGHTGRWWRILSFLFGLPGTLVSWIFVVEGGGRAYGVELPRRREGR